MCAANLWLLNAWFVGSPEGAISFKERYQIKQELVQW